ncbi:MAG: hypothetical protein HY244_15295 [Rhizobiales bacterium]|nr:hypothetical protein [Hyphomicrobiales bacterium]
MQPLAIPQAMQRHIGCQLAVDAKPAKFDPVLKPDPQDGLDLGRTDALQQSSEQAVGSIKKVENEKNA